MKNKWKISPLFKLKNNYILWYNGARAYGDGVYKYSGGGSFIAVVRPTSLQVIMEREHLEAASRNLSKEFIGSIEKIDDYIFTAEKAWKRAFTYDKRLPKDYKSLTNEKLFSYYNKYLEEIYNIQAKVAYKLGITNFYANYLEDYIRGKIAEYVGLDKADKTYLELMSEHVPESRLFKEEQELKLIALRIEKIIGNKSKIKYSQARLASILKSSPEIEGKLNKHVNKYAWMGCVYNYPGFSKKHFMERLLVIINEPAPTDHKNIGHNLKISIKRRIENDLGQILRLQRYMIFAHTELMLAIVYVIGHSKKIFKELSRRTGIAVKDINTYLLEEEISNILFKSKKSSLKIKEEIKKRRSLTVLRYTPPRKYELFSGDKARKYLIREFLTTQPKAEADKKEEAGGALRGLPACSGKVTGRVIKISEVRELNRMQEGKILVAPITVPQLLPAMKKARAIVTEIGGITSHAAIVSRELGIPCVVGVKRITSLVKDGDFIEVDADNGVIKIKN